MAKGRGLKKKPLSTWFTMGCLLTILHYEKRFNKTFLNVLKRSITELPNEFSLRQLQQVGLSPYLDIKLNIRPKIHSISIITTQVCLKHIHSKKNCPSFHSLQSMESLTGDFFFQRSPTFPHFSPGKTEKLLTLFQATHLKLVTYFLKQSFFLWLWLGQAAHLFLSFWGAGCFSRVGFPF